MAIGITFVPKHGMRLGSETSVPVLLTSRLWGCPSNPPTAGKIPQSVLFFCSSCPVKWCNRKKKHSLFWSLQKESKFMKGNPLNNFNIPPQWTYLNLKHDKFTLISALADYEISLTSSSTTEWKGLGLRSPLDSTSSMNRRDFLSSRAHHDHHNLTPGLLRALILLFKVKVSPVECSFSGSELTD